MPAIQPAVRFCLIGAGRAGSIHAVNLAKRIKSAELVAVCDADKDAAVRTAQELDVSRVHTDYNEAVAQQDIDAVVIVTPTFLHCAIACAAAQNGKHIFLEKPMAITALECDAINNAAAKQGVTLQIGFMRRFDQGFLRAKEIIDAGDLGRVMIIKSTGRGPGLPPPWIYDIAKSNGILAEVNSHDFDTVRWMVGSDVARVYAEAANFKCADATEEWPQFYDNAVVNMRFQDGTLGVVDGTCPAHYGYDARVEILGEKGMLRVGHVDDGGVSQVTLDGSVVSSAVKSWRTLFKDAYLSEMEHFIECIRNGTVPRVSGIDGLRAVQAVVASNQSLVSGLPVTIDGAPLR